MQVPLALAEFCVVSSCTLSSFQSVCVLAEVYIYIFAFSFLSYGFSGIYCLISINNKIVLRHLFYKMWLVFLKFTLLPFGVGLAELTNISHDAVCLFSNNSQMKSKSGKNKNIGT